MICCAIANYHPMIGVDLHNGYPLLVPVPLVPLAPHLVFAMVRFGPWWMASSQENLDIKMPPGNAMAKVFDIGMFVPHITFPAMNHVVHMLINTLGSSSQGHFGVSSVQTPKGPLAVALALIVNPQLECGDPCPLPTGFVIAPNTVIAGMTLGDFLAGVFSMAITSAVQFACSKVVDLLYDFGPSLVSKAGKWVGERAGRSFAQVGGHVSSGVGKVLGAIGREFGDLGEMICEGLVRTVRPEILLPIVLTAEVLKKVVSRSLLFSSRAVASAVRGVLSDVVTPLVGRVVAPIISDAAKPVLNEIGKLVLGWITGSPMGYAFGFSVYNKAVSLTDSMAGLPAGSNPIQSFSEWAGHGLADMLEGNAGQEIHDYFEDPFCSPVYPLETPVTVV
ncbi:hypothetical protein G6O69_07590 [Pseudenhygromyxa sp. WMMC2535]|uniref:hypothetical protein n=1 Tax=Pseudenhygromyxa sp. WMMC2535 TaxID=2712867 RepID=UPI001555A5BB|nr:hypothetical protein [Pseudenhygromyxa sp. WMMC2535]NVB37691.1 hypothetical protein [Pseudenhygromyxa sp. WMMC2535]